MYDPFDNEHPFSIEYVTEIEGMTIQGCIDLTEEKYKMYLEMEKQNPSKDVLEIVAEIRTRITQ